MAALSDLEALIAGLAPRLRPGRYVFVSRPEDEPVKGTWRPIMTFLEDEGRTLVLEAKVAKAAGLTASAKLAWITLEVHSDLEAVGLTAAVSGALAEAGISCNVVAAAYHDHLFVPAYAADRALAVLQELAERPFHVSRHAAGPPEPAGSVAQADSAALAAQGRPAGAPSGSDGAPGRRPRSPG